MKNCGNCSLNKRPWYSDTCDECVGFNKWKGKDMSMISNQIDQLRAYARGRKGEIADMCNNAAYIIELLNDKLKASKDANDMYKLGWKEGRQKLLEAMEREING